MTALQGRKELKFVCDDRLLIQIENRIKGIMKKDAHQSGASYNVRSIYFDSPYDDCLSDNESGIGSRSKYRIRIYDCSDSVIKAEVKNKYYDTTMKESSSITRDQFLACINARSLSSISGNIKNNEAVMKLASKITAEGYRPAAIVEYERTAYTYPLYPARCTHQTHLHTPWSISACGSDHYPRHRHSSQSPHMLSTVPQTAVRQVRRRKVRCSHSRG